MRSNWRCEVCGALMAGEVRGRRPVCPECRSVCAQAKAEERAERRKKKAAREGKKKAAPGGVEEIAKVNRAAAAAGLSYGQWQAQRKE